MLGPVGSLVKVKLMGTTDCRLKACEIQGSLSKSKGERAQAWIKRELLLTSGVISGTMCRNVIDNSLFEESSGFL